MSLIVSVLVILVILFAALGPLGAIGALGFAALGIVLCHVIKWLFSSGKW